MKAREKNTQAVPVSRYMTPDLSEENFRTDDAGNRYYNLFILPEKFKERGSTGTPREPTPIREMNTTCKGPAENADIRHPAKAVCIFLS